MLCNMIGNRLGARPLSLPYRCTARLCTRKLIRSRFQSTSSKQSTQGEAQRLTWPEYLAIRGSKRKWQTVRELCLLVGISE